MKIKHFKRTIKNLSYFKNDNFYSLDSENLSHDLFNQIFQIIQCKNDNSWVAVDNNFGIIGYLKNEYEYKLLFI